MSDIEVSTALRRARLVGNGTAGPFAFTFEINNQSDIKVYVDSTLKTRTTHYTVTINTNGTGSVSFTTGNHPTNSQKVTIVSDVPVSRTSVYTSGGNITAASLESDFDKHTMMIGDQKERTLRALSAPVYDPLDVTLVLPDASTRASKFLSFDLAGNITVSGLNSINALTLSDLTVTNPIFTVNGTTGAPAIAPTSNADTGVAFIDGSGVQIIVDGSIAGNFGASSSSVGILSVANGSKATPGLSFTGGTDTGLYHANGKMYVSHDNNETIEITNAVTKLNSNTVNLGPSVAVIGNNMQGISTLTATNANISSTLTVDDVTFSGVTAGASWDRGTNRFILNDNAKIAFGTGQDVLFSFDGTNLQITGGNINHVGNFETDQLALTTSTNTTTVTKILDDDSMSGNDASALVTQQSVKQYVDTQVARFDSLEEILANSASTGTYTLLVDTGEIKFNDNRYLTLGSDNDFRARHDSGTTTFTGDVTFDGNLKFQNNHALAFGDSSPLYIYSDGTTSFIKENGSGDLRIQASVLDIKNVAGTNSIAKFTQNAGADLFYGSNRRLHTTNAGAVVTGNLQVTGNVTIDGSSTTVNSTTVTVDDPIFTLGGDTAPSSDDNKDRGIEFRWHNGSAAKVGFFGFDDSTGKFTFIPDATNSSEVFSGSTGTITAALEGNADTASFMSGLSDPGADRLVMWDESANAHAFVSIGSGLSLSGTTLTGNASANDATITLSAGTALSGGGDFTTDQSSNETITFNLNHLGLENLADPNADRIVFWDDSAGSMQFLTVGSNLTLSGTTLSGTSAANDATINLIAGTAISGGGNFTTDQSAAESITFNLNHLGLESLADPDDDRIFFWDDSAGAAKWLDLGTNLAISGTTLNATDTNTQYTAGTGLGLSSTEFSIDTAVVPQLAGNSTFTGANTFSGNNTFSGVTDFTADLEISSGNKINLNNVLYIDSGGTLYSTGSNPLYLKSTDIRIGDETGRIAFRSYDVGSNLNAALSYNSSEKLKTINSGIAVTGLITVSGTVDGRDVAGDGTKLDGIASGAQVNQNAFTTVAVSGQNNIVADAASDTLTLAAGSNVTITTADSTDTVTVAATNTTYSAGSGIGLSGTAFSVAAGTGLSQTTSGLELSHLGLESLSDPNDDRILFWDDSAGATAFLDIGTGLSISGTTLNASATDLSSYATESYVTTQITNLVDSAPGTLNTLNELAAALGDDAAFSTTVTNSIATKLPLAGGTMTGALNFSQSASNSGRKNVISALHTSNNTFEIQQFGFAHANAPRVNQIAASNAEQHIHIVTDASATVDAGTSTKGIFLRSGGNVGIGTQSPAGTLHLHSADTALRLTSSQGSNTPLAQLQYSSSGGYFLRLGDSANNEDVMIRSYGDSHFKGGHVAIGRTAPVSGLASYTQLTVSGAEGGISINSTDTTTGDYSRLMFTKSGSTGNEGLIRYNTGDYHMSFWTAASEAFRISAAGDLLVGTTDTTVYDNSTASSASNGHNIRADGKVDHARYTTTAGAAVLGLNRVGSDGYLAELRKDGAAFAFFGVNGGDNLQISASTADHAGLEFATHIVAPLEAGAASNGTIDLGADSARFKDLYLSGEVKLPNCTLADQVIKSNTFIFKNGAGSTEYARFDSGNFTVNGVTFKSNSNVTRNLKIQPSGTETDVGVSIYTPSGSHSIQLYGNATEYGFLDANWAGWDIKKTKNGAFQVDEGSGLQRVFNDGYHPNADKWTTARTLSLSGDASGSVSWDGSANATLSVTVADDSHNHDGRYFTEGESNVRYVYKNGDNNGAVDIRVDNGDFIVRDNGDSVTNYIWRDHSAGALYLGTANAVITARSYINANSNNLTQVNDIGLINQLYSHGDGNSYIEFHGADQFRVVVGGSERLEVNNTGYEILITGDVAATGNITAYYSDERLKTKTGKIENALDKVSSLEGFYYVENDLAKSCGFDNEQTQVALSAQQVQAVMPECVSLAPFDIDNEREVETGKESELRSASGENYLTIDYAKLIPLLVESIKQLKAKVEALENGSSK